MQDDVGGLEVEDPNQPGSFIVSQTALKLTLICSFYRHDYPLASPTSAGVPSRQRGRFPHAMYVRFTMF